MKSLSKYIDLNCLLAITCFKVSQLRYRTVFAYGRFHAILWKIVLQLPTIRKWYGL